MVLFCAPIKCDSVSVLRLHFFRYVNVMSCTFLPVCLQKYPEICLSTHFDVLRLVVYFVQAVAYQLEGIFIFHWPNLLCLAYCTFFSLFLELPPPREFKLLSLLWLFLLILLLLVLFFIIVILVLLIVIFLIRCYFTSVLADGILLKCEWREVSSNLQNSSQCSGWSHQCYSLVSLYSSSYF